MQSYTMHMHLDIRRSLERHDLNMKSAQVEAPVESKEDFPQVWFDSPKIGEKFGLDLI